MQASHTHRKKQDSEKNSLCENILVEIFVGKINKLFQGGKEASFQGRRGGRGVEGKKRHSTEEEEVEGEE